VLFPFYVRVLLVIRGISLAIYALVLVAFAVSGNPRTVGDAMTSVAFQIVVQFAVITGIFAAAER
jgi:hypothetical protein